MIANEGPGPAWTSRAAAIALIVGVTGAATAQTYPPPPYGSPAQVTPYQGQGSDRITPPAPGGQLGAPGASPFAPPPGPGQAMPYQGQAPQGGFGQPPQGGFGQAPQGGFGQPPQGGFGQPQGGFGQAPPGAFGQPPQGGFGQPPRGEQVNLPPGANAQALQALAQQERQDFGVPPTPELHRGQLHGQTPTSIPGGKLIDTLNLLGLMSHQPPVPLIVVDALGAQIRLPNAIQAAWAAQGNSFQDQAQQQLGQYLDQASGGDRSKPLVVYCSDPNCWMSYNVALRAIRLGYRNVLWYRGGLWAWQQAGLPTQPQQQR